MRRSYSQLTALVAALAATSPALAQDSGTSARFESRACDDQTAIAAGARCGVVRVPEDYSRPLARQIELNVIVLPAKHPNATGTAQYDLEGGPGFAATDFLSFYLGEGAPYREQRDIVLADMRGTGKSNPLRCSGIEAYEREQPTAPMYPPELVAACAKDLSARVDLTSYSTLAAARDVQAIRLALGYRQLDLNAVSYGTTLALRYIAEFPDRVRSAVMVGTVPPDKTPPRYHAQVADAALAKLTDDCAHDAQCALAFGDVAGDLDRALAQTGRALAPIKRDVFMEKLRTLLYATPSQRRVPLLLHLAAQGDFSAFTSRTPAAVDRPFADGLYLSITCAESFDAFNLEAAVAAAGATRFGDYRVTRQGAACSQWPRVRKSARAEPMKRIQSSVPVLFLAGEMDPVSPPEWAAETFGQFGAGRLEVVRHGAHVFDGLTGMTECFDRVVIRFFDAGSARGLDTSCLASMRPPAYATRMQR